MVHSTMRFRNVVKQFTPLLICVGLLLFVSCQDTLSVDPQEDFIVFGQFNGYCLGDACFIFYALTEDVLLESNVDKYSGSGFYPGYRRAGHEVHEDKRQCNIQHHAQ